MKFIKSNLLLILASVTGVIILAFQAPVTNAVSKSMMATQYETPSEYSVPKVWNLPNELNEISGITWLDDHTFACVQDEDGIIYIYDTNQNKITDAFKFADAGDYEGIAVNNKDAYVMRSDGVIFEIKNYKSDTREVAEFKTQFSSKNNMESLTYDKAEKRFLTAPKDVGLKSNSIKNIYQISFQTQSADINPITEIDLTNDKLKDFQDKKIQKTFSPSEIAVHPITKDIYVLEGKKPKLMILDKNGVIKKVMKLDKNNFAQPEGMTFSDDGRLFISNEAVDNEANIVEVIL